MNVVSKSEAARVAGVTRQAINELSKINSLDKKKYRFFVYSPDNGKHGVDIEHKEWKSYIDRNKHKRVKRNISSNNAQSKSNVNIGDDYVHKANILTAVVSMLKEDFNFNGAKLKMALEGIERRYNGLEG